MSTPDLFSIVDFGFWIGIENRKSKIQNEQPNF
jgi:hypothetical protein